MAKMPKAKRRYRCARCKRVVVRVSDKQWIKSYCDRTDGQAHLQLVR